MVLFADENPRSLVWRWEPGTRFCVNQAIDAIFIPYRTRVDYVTELISTIANVDTNIYLLPTSDNDIERLPVDHKKRVNVLRLFDAEFSG